MNYAQIRKLDVTNGPGVRTTLFVSGCTHNCKGCFNKEQQDFSYGKHWDREAEERLITASKNPHVVGINILGGEPLQQVMDSSLFLLLHRLNVEIDKPIWLWTGYTWEDIVIQPHLVRLLSLIDVLIDGPYIEEEKDLALMFRGSRNQRVIDVARSLQENRIIEMFV